MQARQAIATLRANFEHFDGAADGKVDGLVTRNDVIAVLAADNKPAEARQVAQVLLGCPDFFDAIEVAQCNGPQDGQIGLGDVDVMVDKMDPAWDAQVTAVRLQKFDTTCKPAPVEQDDPIQEPDQPVVCEPKALDTSGWRIPGHLRVDEANTQRYRVAWTLRTSNCHGEWPRKYDYTADCDGWISDTFVIGGCSSGRGRVFWNLNTNEIRVEGPNDLGMRRAVAQHAKNTIFPGMNMSTLK